MAHENPPQPQLHRHRSVATELRRHLSAGVVVVAVNAGLYLAGSVAYVMVPAAAKPAANICDVAYLAAHALVPLTLLYAPLRRYALPQRRWDGLGPGLAVLQLLLLRHLLAEPGWQLPAWPW